MTDISKIPAKRGEFNVTEAVATVHKLHAEVTRGMDAAVELGHCLRTVKDQLGHGLFVKWVRTECPFALRTAQLYMKAAAEEKQGRLRPETTLRTLANPSAKTQRVASSPEPTAAPRRVPVAIAPAPTSAPGPISVTALPKFTVTRTGWPLLQRTTSCQPTVGEILAPTMEPVADDLDEVASYELLRQLAAKSKRGKGTPDDLQQVEHLCAVVLQSIEYLVLELRRAWDSEPRDPETVGGLTQSLMFIAGLLDTAHDVRHSIADRLRAV
jgi:hypothetical protein